MSVDQKKPVKAFNVSRLGLRHASCLPAP